MNPPYKNWPWDIKFMFWVVVLIPLIFVASCAAKKVFGADIHRPLKVEMHGTHKRMIDATNEMRAQYGLPALRSDVEIQHMAESWGKHMARNGLLQHSGYPVAENIAWGQWSVTEVMQSWMNSRGHRANILGRYTRIGCAVYMGPQGRCYWVSCFK